MKKAILFILPILAIASCAIWLKLHKKEVKSAPIALIEEKAFVIIVPSYNNEKYVEKNLSSIFSQNYQNYRVIYIDDFSSDGTLEKATSLLKETDCKVELITNKQNLGALANIYNAVHSCSDSEIVVLVDGDDFLAHEDVLQTLNRAYSTETTWMTYGNFLDYPSYTQKPVSCHAIPRMIIEKNAIRKHEWLSTHLRSFYAGLFKQIPIHELFYRGRFFAMGWDLAFMMPMIEMSGEKARFIPEVLYLYNRQNPISDHKINFKYQEQCANEVRGRKPFAKLASIPFKGREHKERADLVIFSFHRPMQLYALLESVEACMEGLDRISVLYRADTPEYRAGYHTVQSRFPKVRFVQQKNPPYDFKELAMQLTFDTGVSGSEYVLFAVDDMIVKESIDLSECIKQMRTTQAHGLYLCHSEILDTCYMLSRHQGIPTHTPLQGITSEDALFAWQFSAGSDDWAYPNSLDLVLYNKNHIKKDFDKIAFSSPTSLESEWNLRAKKKRVGLFYSKAKALNIPANLVTDEEHRHLEAYSTEELLSKFEAGLKIDITPLQAIEARSRHVAADLSFTARE